MLSMPSTIFYLHCLEITFAGSCVEGVDHFSFATAMFSSSNEQWRDWQWSWTWTYLICLPMCECNIIVSGQYEKMLSCWWSLLCDIINSAAPLTPLWPDQGLYSCSLALLTSRQCRQCGINWPFLVKILATIDVPLSKVLQSAIMFFCAFWLYAMSMMSLWHMYLIIANLDIKNQLLAEYNTTRLGLRNPMHFAT